MTKRRECLSCGSRENETAFPAIGTLCTDCVNESVTAPRDCPRTPARSRRSYRAALRYRLKSDQLDLVDLVTPIPGGSLVDPEPADTLFGAL